jgi:hypothetical protein
LATVADDDSVATGHDANVSAEHGAVAAGAIHGNVTVVQAGPTGAVPAAAARLPVSLSPRPLVLAGREELLANLHGLLAGDDGSVQVVVLCGLGGGRQDQPGDRVRAPAPG